MSQGAGTTCDWNRTERWLASGRNKRRNSGSKMVEVEQSGVAGRLRIADEWTSWRELPEWLRFFFQLGERVAAFHETGIKTCAVVIPPVRAYAAVFAATGAGVGTAMTARAVPEIDAHFDALASLEQGTSVVVKMGERIYAATFKGTAESFGKPCLRIEYDNMIQLLPKQDCHRVQVGEGGKRTLPKTSRRNRSKASVIHELLGDDSEDYLSIPTVDTVLIGTVSLLIQELEAVKIRSSGDGVTTTTLGALLRPRRVLPDGGISRSLLLSDRVADISMPVEDVPHVAVFDGARALARRRSEFSDSSWIAILDRCCHKLRRRRRYRQ